MIFYAMDKNAEEHLLPLSSGESIQNIHILFSLLYSFSLSLLALFIYFAALCSHRTHIIIIIITVCIVCLQSTPVNARIAETNIAPSRVALLYYKRSNTIGNYKSISQSHFFLFSPKLNTIFYYYYYREIIRAHCSHKSCYCCYGMQLSMFAIVDLSKVAIFMKFQMKKEIEGRAVR